MEGCSSGVDQSWVCCGVLAGYPTRDYSILLYEEGLACCGCHKYLHRDLKEGCGRPSGMS